MIKVSILQVSNDRVEITVRGHADYSEQGTDIVCAGVSALAITTANSLDYHGFSPLVEAFDDGLLKVKVAYPKEEVPVAVVNAIIETFRLGISSMAESYGDYIRLVDDRT